MIPLTGPAVVETKEGDYELPEGWRGHLAIDADGDPYPIEQSVYERSYEPAPAGERAVVAKAKYFLPGAFFAEDTTYELEERSVDAAVAAAPAQAFAFVLVDVPVVDFEYDQDRFTVFSKPQNESGKYYLGGEVFTADELRARAIAEGDPDKYRTLIANVSHFDGGRLVEGRAICCRTGNWQPFGEGDELVAVESAAAPAGSEA